MRDLVYYAAAGYRGIFLRDAFLLQSLPSAVYTLVLGAVVFYFAAGFKAREV